MVVRAVGSTCYALFMDIWLRNLSPDLEAVIVEMSRREGISLNKATLRLLEASIRRPARNADFDDFFGKWSTSDADSFEETLRSMRQVEPVDWNLAN
jgi:hypothetical protein